MSPILKQGNPKNKNHLKICNRIIIPHNSKESVHKIANHKTFNKICNKNFNQEERELVKEDTKHKKD